MAPWHLFDRPLHSGELRASAESKHIHRTTENPTSLCLNQIIFLKAELGPALSYMLLSRLVSQFIFSWSKQQRAQSLFFTVSKGEVPLYNHFQRLSSNKNCSQSQDLAWNVFHLIFSKFVINFTLKTIKLSFQPLQNTVS